MISSYGSRIAFNRIVHCAFVTGVDQKVHSLRVNLVIWALMESRCTYFMLVESNPVLRTLFH